MTVSELLSSLSRDWLQVSYWVREFFGENAYPRYVAAWQAQHADLAVVGAEHRLLDEREFFSQHIERLYGNDVQRCC